MNNKAGAKLDSRSELEKALSRLSPSFGCGPVFRYLGIQDHPVVRREAIAASRRLTDENVWSCGISASGHVIDACLGNHHRQNLLDGAPRTHGLSQPSPGESSKA